MECPRCKAQLPPPERGQSRGGERQKPDGEARRSETAAVAPQEALRADAPPAPCPQCGWSTMWNE